MDYDNVFSKSTTVRTCLTISLVPKKKPISLEKKNKLCFKYTLNIAQIIAQRIIRPIIIYGRF